VTSAEIAERLPRSARRPTTLGVYRWELRKLVSQKRTYIGLGAAAILPVIFVSVMAFQTGGPYDAPLGHNLRHTGIALTLVVLVFASRFGAQLVTALVAGDIVANEDSGGTLKMALTRSTKRAQLLGAKTLASFTYVVALLLAIVTTGMIAGIIAWGFNPVVDLSGRRLAAAHAFGLSFAALAIYGVPLLAIAAFGIFLSTVTRNSAAAIVGTLVYELFMEAIVGLVHLKWLPHWVLSSQFDAWQGFFDTPFSWTPIVRALWVSAIYAAVPLAVAFWYFLRRDVAGE
jgi:ABC-2 type transport system permease protein